MALAGKELGEYFAIIKLPLMIAIGISLLGFILGLIPILGWLGAILLGLAGLLIGIALAAWVGWTTVKSHDGTMVNSLIAGVMLGVLGGIAGGLISFVRILSAGAATAGP